VKTRRKRSVSAASSGLTPAQQPDLGRWGLEFEGMPGYPSPTVCRIRMLLKTAKRAYGLRCTRVYSPVAAAEPADSANHEGG
jgi:hypothetical protein